MRDYGKIVPQFWLGDTGKRLRGFPEAQVVALYLSSSPHANMLGVYFLPMQYLSYETGLGMDGASKGLLRCVEVGFCHYDPETEFVWVVKLASIQVGETLLSTDKRCKGIQKQYDALPSNPFLPCFFDSYHDHFHMQTRRGFEGACKGLLSQEQEQEHYQEQEQPLPGREPLPMDSNGREPAHPWED